MYEIQVDRDQAIVALVLDGLIRDDEMLRFTQELRTATLSLGGRDIKIKADVRTFKPASPEAADMIAKVQEFGLQNGVSKVAEIVESQMTALQLNRVAKQSGTDKILRRFWEDESALDWLLRGDGGSPST